MPMTASSITSGKASCAASGNSGREKRRNPYAPILSSTPARSTEPPVGASVWASGSQVCSGTMGTFTMNATVNAANSHTCSV